MMGPRLVSLFGYMKAAMGVSIREIKEFSRDVLAVRFSDSSVQNAVFQVSDAISPVYDEIRRALPDQKALNIDETGWKEQGSRHWVWVFCNACLAVFVISKSRGCAVLEDVLGKNFLGALTSDFFSAYVKYASPKQQFCLAHLIRDMKFLTTLPSPEAKAFGIKLLAFMRRVFKLWHRRHELSDTEWKKKSSRFVRDFDRYLCTQRFEKRSPARTLKRRLLRHSRSLWRFLDEPSLYEPTNNHAERTIRHLVRLRRISQGSRGSNGSRWTERAASVLATARLQKKNAWNVFLDAVNARYFGHLPPSLAYVQ
jgi:transposase